MVKLLKEVARPSQKETATASSNSSNLKNAVVLCTIHQPSSEVFHEFDIVIFMKAGRIFYQGPVSSLNSYFASKGYNCPQDYNPCDFVMTIIQTETVESLDAKGVFMSPPSHLSGSDDNAAKAVAVTKQDEAFLEYMPNVHAAYLKQINWLAYREGLNVVRDVGGQ